jgi:hypothetical protein
MPGYHEIRMQLGGDDGEPWFVIHRGAAILALMIRSEKNPNIHATPAEVWVGAEDPLLIWGERLAKHTEALPVYVSPREGADYELKGHYTVTDRERTNIELINAVHTVGYGLSRIVFLMEA